jgi:hypothetical protein
MLCADKRTLAGELDRRGSGRAKEFSEDLLGSILELSYSSVLVVS